MKIYEKDTFLIYISEEDIYFLWAGKMKLCMYKKILCSYYGNGCVLVKINKIKTKKYNIVWR